MSLEENPKNKVSEASAEDTAKDKVQRETQAEGQEKGDGYVPPAPDVPSAQNAREQLLVLSDHKV